MFALSFNAISDELAPGDTVTVGQSIGQVGSSGRSAEPLLHFEVWGEHFYRPVDPWSGDCQLTVPLWRDQPRATSDVTHEKILLVRASLAGEPSQYVVKDAAIFVVSIFIRSIDSNSRFEHDGLTIGAFGGHRHF